MHLREVTVKRKGKTYRYAQLVESYRRESDGMPAHRTVANLGQLSPEQVQNLRAALQANREGKALVVAGAAPTARANRASVLRNLRYADLAVLLEAWRELELGSLLEELVGESATEVRVSDVVATLVLQRCVAPGSKLSAERWFPSTCLPELFGMAPARLNNTRIHRALDRLEAVDGALQSRLPGVYQARGAEFGVLFMDVTDTWFVGRGPEIADRAKTKEGFFRKRVAIALVCDQSGLPLRWRVFSGRTPDNVAMGELVREVSDSGWLGEHPIVLDRAMGTGAMVGFLQDAGLRFLTAVPRPEYETYSLEIPFAHFADFPVSSTDDTFGSEVARAVRIAATTSLNRVDDDLFVVDLGFIQPTADATSRSAARHAEAQADAGDPSAQPVRSTLALAQRLAAEIAAGVHTSIKRAAAAHGLSKSGLSNYLKLLDLAPEVQARVEQGEAEALSLSSLRRIAAQAALDQAAAFAAALASARSRRSTVGQGLGASHREGASARREAVRVIAYFNPELFVRQRRTAAETLADIDARIADLNVRLGVRTRSAASVYAEVGRILQKRSLMDTFDVELRSRPDGRPEQVVLTRKDAVWNARRRYDGFNVLVAHPALTQSPAELVGLYRAKDAVERDFRTIKSVLELRPVRHQTAPKLRAHVTICMLALLLERHLEQRLTHAGLRCTAELALERLSTCHLNILAGLGRTTVYTVTSPTPDQNRLLEALKLEHLAQDELVANLITPR